MVVALAVAAVAVRLLGVGDVACKHTRSGSVGIDATLDPQSWQIWISIVEATRVISHEVILITVFLTE